MIRPKFREIVAGWTHCADSIIREKLKLASILPSLSETEKRILEAMKEKLRAETPAVYGV